MRRIVPGGALLLPPHSTRADIIPEARRTIDSTAAYIHITPRCACSGGPLARQ